ncbi:MAG: NAD-dependent DNA ligase LigA [Candidatus Heimdallarchaeaceae archaeon]
MKDYNLEKLRYYRYTYYNDSPVISDDYYDSYERGCKQLFPDDPIWDEVGATPISGDLIVHAYKMLSLEKSVDISSFNKSRFFKKFKDELAVVSVKEDGCAAELFYEKGNLKIVSTRGDGEVGQNITHLASGIENIPKEIEDNDSIWVYGEFVMTKSDFNKYKREYINPRNLVSGTMRVDGSSKLAKDRNIKFIAYGMRMVNPTRQLMFLLNRFVYLKQLGFEVVEHLSINVSDVETMFYNRMLEERDSFPTQIDGVCVFLNDISKSMLLGCTSHHPRYAAAIKFPSEEKSVTVKNIRWDISKNGVLTPVAEFDPVDLGGAMVGSCTLHNWRCLMLNNIAKGTNILIKRSGDVIPYFIKVEGEAAEYEQTAECPQSCPYCGESTSVDEVRLYCTNSKCSEVLVMFIEEMLSRLDHKGLAAQQIRILYNFYSLDNFWSLFKLNETDFKILGVNQGPKIYSSLKSVKNKTQLWRFIWALGIPGIGKTLSKRLAKFYQTYDNFVDGEAIAYKVLGAGDTLSKYLIWWDKNIEEVKCQINELKFNILSVVSNENKNSLNICITGTLSKPRKEFEKLLEENGHVFQKSITKETSFLVTGENPGGSKIPKAEKYGIKIITEDELYMIIGNN